MLAFILFACLLLMTSVGVFICLFLQEGDSNRLYIKMDDMRQDPPPIMYSMFKFSFLIVLLYN